MNIEAMAQHGLSNDRASNEATAWLIELGESPNDPDVQARFAAWLAADPAHADAWAESTRAYDMLSPALARHRARRTFRKRTAYSVATAGLAAVLAVFAMPGFLIAMRADYSTPAGEVRDVRLEDGSTISLGPESSVAVSQTGDHRHIQLLKGRAYFDVVTDASRPFEVDAGDVTITVLGTAFDVQTGGTSTTVGVRRGRVQVQGEKPAAEPRILGAGDWVEVRLNGNIAAGTGMPEHVGAWRQGQLFVIDRPIADVISELRPYFKGLIVIADKDIGRRRVTGIYSLQRPIEGLRAVAQAHSGVSIREVSPWLVVVSAQ